MPLDRSSDDLQAAGAAVVENSPFCTICNLAIQNPSVLSETVCRHTFHKICISSYIKTHSDCPACGSKIIKDAKQVNSSATQKVGSSITTRSTSKARILMRIEPTSHFDENQVLILLQVLRVLNQL